MDKLELATRQISQLSIKEDKLVITLDNQRLKIDRKDVKSVSLTNRDNIKLVRSDGLTVFISEKDDLIVNQIRLNMELSPIDIIGMVSAYRGAQIARGYVGPFYLRPGIRGLNLYSGHKAGIDFVLASPGYHLTFSIENMRFPDEIKEGILHRPIWERGWAGHPHRAALVDKGNWDS